MGTAELAIGNIVRRVLHMIREEAQQVLLTMIHATAEPRQSLASTAQEASLYVQQVVGE